MMNPKAMEALRKARELFAQQADDIPNNATPVEPLRKPVVHLIPTNAPKFTKETMKQEHKETKTQGLARVLQENGHSSPQQIDAYVEMSVTKAVEVCLAKGIKKAGDIAKETGKNVNQVYTAMWKVKQNKRKTKLLAKLPKQPKQPNLTHEQFDWEKREPTAFEDAHYVVLKSREEYEKEIDRVCEQRNALEKENAELKAVIKYLERKVMV